MDAYFFVGDSIFFLTYLFPSIDFPFPLASVVSGCSRTGIGHAIRSARTHRRPSRSCPDATINSGEGGAMAKRRVLLVVLFFITKSNISCFLFFDFDAQDLRDRGSGRDRLRSSGSRDTEEG